MNPLRCSLELDAATEWDNLKYQNDIKKIGKHQIKKSDEGSYHYMLGFCHFDNILLPY
jgi:hypothetical protein